MQISFIINNEPKTFDVAPNETLLHTLRANGYFGVKHGCDNGECGACAVLVRRADEFVYAAGRASGWQTHHDD